MLAFIISLFLLSPSPSLEQVRELYQLSAQNEKKCRELLILLDAYNENNHPLFAGYKASAVMIMAQHTSNPFQKLSYFNTGKRQLEKAIEKSKGDVELRCLRFAVQSNIPAFLGYKGHLQADKQFILSKYPTVSDKVLKKNIRYFMEQWGNLTQAENAVLK